MRILLAEDEHVLGTWLCKALEQTGIQVEWVDDGRLVDRALQQRDHDALVLDLGLPGLDGHTVLQRLRQRDQRLPTLILTARDSLAERVASLNAGADDFLAKPFALAELEARLHALVRRTRGRVAILNSHVWSIARRHDAFVLDVWGMRALRDWRMWAPDRIHLTNILHNLVDNAVRAAVQGDLPSSVRTGP